jgi:hypothetical protein
MDNQYPDRYVVTKIKTRRPEKKKSIDNPIKDPLNRWHHEEIRKEKLAKRIISSPQKHIQEKGEHFKKT